MANDDLAQPIDFSRRSGDGIHLGLSLGGGGVFFVAWQVTYLEQLAKLGINLKGAGRVVGTSAGSLVASILESGGLRRFEREVSFFSKTPALISALAPSGSLKPSQQRALDLFVAAQDADPAVIRSIGHEALAAATPSAGKMARSVAVLLLSRKWPGKALHITCVDTLTGERCVVTQDSGVLIERAVAASSAVPGIFSPQPIGDRRCMDGGISGSGTHLDLLAGCDRAVVLSLVDGTPAAVGAMTQTPGGFAKEIAQLKNSGTAVFHRYPESVDLTKLMDPKSVPAAILMAKRQATADADELKEFII
ncbi:MAG: patatin-like phospholipase family protein [Acidimicrobiales bacterium]